MVGTFPPRVGRLGGGGSRGDRPGRRETVLVADPVCIATKSLDAPMKTRPPIETVTVYPDE